MSGRNSEVHSIALELYFRHNFQAMSMEELLLRRDGTYMVHLTSMFDVYREI